MSGVPRSTHDGTPGSYDVISMRASAAVDVDVGTVDEGDDRPRRGPIPSTAMPHDVRVLDQFSPDDVASIRALADEVEAEAGTNPFGEVTWTGLDGRGTLGDRGVL